MKRHILNHQSVTTGLFPVSSGMADSEVGSVRDTVYCCQAMWALYLGYEKIDQVISSPPLGSCKIEKQH